MIRSITTLAEPARGNVVCMSRGWSGHYLLPSFPSLGPFPCLSNDKNEDNIGLHQFEDIYMRGFAGTVTSAALFG